MTMQTFTPEQYLRIDIASNFGLDKANWDVRLEWFEDNINGILEIVDLAANNPADLHKHPIMREAESPALVFAGITAWAKASNGQSIGYGVGLDATASGAQLLSILIGCEQSARLCNVLDTGRREDLYTNVFELLKQRIGDTEAVSRDDAKTAVMTSLYGSTEQPKRVFGEGEKLDAFYATMEEDLPGVWELNQALLELWNPNALSHDWVLPDNFHVKTKVMAQKIETVLFLDEKHDVISYENRPQARGLSISANVVHSLDGMVVREMGRRCTYDQDRIAALYDLLVRPTTLRANERSPHHQLVKTLWSRYAESGFLSARILEVLDEDNMHLVDKTAIIDLIMTLPHKSFPVLSVHDRFVVHPNRANDLRKQYNQILADLARSNVLQDIVLQLTGNPRTKVNKIADFADKILEANYSLS